MIGINVSNINDGSMEHRCQFIVQFINPLHIWWYVHSQISKYFFQYDLYVFRYTKIHREQETSYKPVTQQPST